MFNLLDNVAIVTGAAGQIGSGIVNGLIAQDARVVATDVSLDELKKVSDKNKWSEDNVILSVCDIRNRSHIKEAIRKGVDKFGEINALVNNAGVSVFEPFLERTEESFDWVTGVNLKGTFLCIQEYTKYCESTGKPGTIVNIASHYGQVSPDPRIYTDCARRNSEVYGATKAGIIQMTRYFAVHLAEHKIRVNCIAPGGVRNPITPQGDDFQKNYGYRCPMDRMGEIEEMVGPILFLLSPAASYVNGQTLAVDGGTTAW